MPEHITPDNEREWLEGLRYEDKFPVPPVMQRPQVQRSSVDPMSPTYSLDVRIADLEAEVERLREALEELDQMHDDCTCRAGKRIIRRALGDG